MKLPLVGKQISMLLPRVSFIAIFLVTLYLVCPKDNIIPHFWQELPVDVSWIVLSALCRICIPVHRKSAENICAFSYLLIHYVKDRNKA